MAMLVPPVTVLQVVRVATVARVVQVAALGPKASRVKKVKSRGLIIHTRGDLVVQVAPEVAVVRVAMVVRAAPVQWEVPGATVQKGGMPA